MKENWTYKKLGEVCSKITDGSHNPPKGVPNSNFIMISSQNVYNDHIEINDVRYLSEDDFNREDKRTKVRANDVLLTIVGTVGRCAVVSEEIGSITLQRSVAVLTPKPFVDSRYLMYCCIGHNSTLNTNAHGIAQKGIYLKQLSELIIPVPPIETQSRIVSELDLLQSIIDKQKAQLKELDNLAQAVFYDMFGDPVENEKEWEVKKLGEVTNKISDGVHAKPNYTETGMPFISVVNINRGKLNFDDCKYVSISDGESFNKRAKPEKGDVLYTKVGATYGISAIVDVDIDFCLYVSVCLIKPKKELINSSFLTNMMRLPYIKHQADERIRGIGVPDLHLNQISAFDIILPPLSLQQSFATKIESIEKQKAAITKSIEETQKLFDYTMDKYFG